MTYAEAIEYLQPIADSSSLKRYSVALNKAIDAMREMQRIEDMNPLMIDAKTAAELRQMMQEVGMQKATILPAEQPIVRCHECEMLREYEVCGQPAFTCGLCGLEVDNDDFCSFGERKVE